jgi:signal transduction histidine kinase
MFTIALLVLSSRGSKRQFLTMTVEFLKTNFFASIFRSQRLMRQFGIVALVTIVAGMATTGAWLTKEIQNGIVEHTTLSTAVFMERFIHPLIYELRTSDRLSEAAIEKLGELTTQGLVQKHVVSIKIWKPDGTVVFSTNRSIIGQKFELEEALRSAVNGQYGTEYGSLEATENIFEKSLGKNLIEVYVPMVEDATGRVFAVSEFYIDANALPGDLNFRYFKSWVVVGLLTLAMLLPFFLIVRRGDKTIETQEAAIRSRMTDLSNLLLENRELNSRVANANRASTSANERFLNRLGADLHDGPVQMLAAAVLWLDSLAQKSVRSTEPKSDEADNIDLVKTTINGVLKEVRSIATGLVLPELANKSLGETLHMTVDVARMRTKTAVGLECADLPDMHSMEVNDAIYRFVQEGLNNSFQHAGGRGQKVKASVIKKTLIVEVSDTGKGFDVKKVQSLPSHLGLTGMHNRITALGGELKIDSRIGQGTTLTARIPLARFLKSRNKDRKLVVA